jgi:hypothetical protein
MTFDTLQEAGMCPCSHFPASEKHQNICASMVLQNRLKSLNAYYSSELRIDDATVNTGEECRPAAKTA